MKPLECFPWAFVCVTLYGDFLTWCLWETLWNSPHRAGPVQIKPAGLLSIHGPVSMGFSLPGSQNCPVSWLMSAQGAWTPCTELSTSISASAQEAWWLDQLDFDDSCSVGTAGPELQTGAEGSTEAHLETGH